MKRLLVALAVFFVLVQPAIGRAQITASVMPTAEPVNTHATPEARALLHELDSISGRATLTGQHNFPNQVSRWTRA
ncbi:hypothetical protein [Granulicella sp. L60]|uniref:hypothetical protein n=1 Tax=Granulicella sp. L60 TaxID=1641866 RepID=UPI00131D8CFB|nr:hypothetical protein [Granulicella sp. L60]